MSRVTVVISDRYPVVLCGLTSVLRAENDFDIVASCHDGRQCMQAIRDLSPNIALLDIFMPTLPGLEILAATQSEKLHTRLVFFTPSLEIREIGTAVIHGAYGVISKEVSAADLVQCLRDVAAGTKVFPFNPETVPDLLTQREQEVMRLVSEGLSNKKIGRRLNISDGTVKVHLHHIYEKLSIKNRATLAAAAVTLLHSSARKVAERSPPAVQAASRTHISANPLRRVKLERFRTV